MSDTQPLAYLMTNSKDSLESYELSRLNRASNLRKEMLQVLERWIDAEAQARMARSILDWKRVEIDNTNQPLTGLQGELVMRLMHEEDMLDAKIPFESDKEQNSGKLCVNFPSTVDIQPDLETGRTKLRCCGIKRKKRAASMLRFLEQCQETFRERQCSDLQISVSSLAIQAYRAETLNRGRRPGYVPIRKKLDRQ